VEPATPAAPVGEEPAAQAASLNNIQQEIANLSTTPVPEKSKTKAEFTVITAAVYNTRRGVLSN
jgi:hypothetical protein